VPRNAVFGDGEPIPDATVARVLEAMTRCTQNIDWRAGDLAILDNMRWMHGRAPYTGARKVHVAMGRRHTDRAVTPLF
jgi:alpha-ketoglutarate-dependent taurine dioxygenase